MLNLKLTYSFVSVCLFTFLSISAGVSFAAQKQCYCLSQCDVPFKSRSIFVDSRGNPASTNAWGILFTCEESCKTPLSKSIYDFEIGVNKKSLSKEEFDSLKEAQILESKNRIKQLEKNFGYKDIKFGLLPVDIETLGVCSSGRGCYNREEWSFDFGYRKDQNRCKTGLTWIWIDVGPYSPNHHQELSAKLEKKYKKNFSFTDRDLERYNSKEINLLNVVYRDGTLILSINRNDAGEHRLAVRYQDEVAAKQFLENNSPKKSDDF